MSDKRHFKTSVGFDAVAERLAGLLDTTLDDEQFDWNSMLVSLPESMVKRIMDDANKERRKK